MVVPGSLLLYACFVVVLVPRLLVGRAWLASLPRAGVLVWQASVASALSALLLLGVTALRPVQSVSLDVGHLVHACSEALRDHDVTSPSVLHLYGAVVAAAVVTLLVRAAVVRALVVRRGRQRQRALLDLVSTRHAALAGVHVLEHEVPGAYCVPGDGGRVVVTTGALACLTDAELNAVLAHERAHLRGRHDLVLFGADVARRAFPRSAFLRSAQAHLRLLVEMVADDRACRTARAADLATALVRLGQQAHPLPSSALGAAGDTLARVERLLAAAPGRRTSGLAAVALSAVLLVTPFVLVLLPAWAASTGQCRLPV